MVRRAGNPNRLSCRGRIARAVSLLAVAGTIFGCQAVRYEARAGAEGREDKITATAYSFNARLWRDGKPTTFKLELYQTDSILGLAGRGYLGKGALKGWLRSDSIKVYFPSTNEYLYESLTDLAASLTCPLPLAGLDILQLLSTVPDSLAYGTDLAVSSDYGDENQPRFRVSAADTACQWLMEVRYDRHESSWRVREFEFDNGRDIRLRAARERYRFHAAVPAARFEVALPSGAVRIIP